jgi:two-component system LytT family response regulator
MKGRRLRVAVIDDERPARRRLERLLAVAEEVELAGSWASTEDALHGLDHEGVDAVFLDIEMPGRSGLELARVLRERAVAVVFVTAHAQHAAEAFDLEAVDYLTKPFEDARFDRALDKLRRGLGSSAPRMARLPVDMGGRVRLVDLEAIECIESSDKHVVVHTPRESMAGRSSLAALEARLDPGAFARVHRRFIVRIAAIAELGRAFHGDWLVTLKSGRQLMLSRRYRDRLPPGFAE